MAGNSSRNKGITGEREIINILQPIVDNIYETLAPNLNKPLLERNQNQTNKGGYDIIGLDWLGIEIKRQETLQLDSWWKQTVCACKKNELPVLIFRQSRKDWKVITIVDICVHSQIVETQVQISLADFLNLFTIKTRQQLLIKLNIPKP